MRAPALVLLAPAGAFRLALGAVLLATSGCPAAQPAPVPPGEARVEPRGPERNRAVREGVRTTVAFRYYEVAGRSVHDLLAAMQREGPLSNGRRFFGLTSTALQYAYGHRSDAGGCRPERVTVVLDVTTTLPRWAIPTGTPYALERDWRHFERSLRGHEDGHRQLAVAEAEALLAAIATLRAPTCDALDAASRAEAEATRARFVAAHGDYDTRTGHGRTQGASWPRE